MMTARKGKDMEQEVIILSADAYNMKLEDGTEKTGTSIHYIAGLEQCCNDTGKSYGYKPVKESLEYDFINQIAQAGGCPIKAKVSFVIRMSGGKQLLKIGKCELLGKVK